MKTLKLKITLLALFAFIASHAQTATPVITEKQIQQNKEIRGGIKSGELNKREARRLKARERKLQREKRHAKSDGVVTRKEKAKLNRELRRTERSAKKQKIY